MNRIEFERRKRRWSQAALAAKVGVSQYTIAAADAGIVSEPVLERISHALLVYPPEVLLREVRVQPEPEELTEARP